MKNKIIIGTSSCLLGSRVRHDGSHKRDRFLTDVLSEYFDFQPFCPETSIGMSIPRPAIRLIRRSDEIRLVESDKPENDYTESMQELSARYAAGLNDISGYILKSKSPSCGMERVNLYNEKGYPEKKGVGLFAYELIKANPHLPVEEEGRLHDARLRENFIERVFAFHRWREMMSSDYSVNGLMNFHKQHKFILLAHNESIYRELGKLVAQANIDNLDDTAGAYIENFTTAMKHIATRKRHVNVLQHCMGFMKQQLESDDKSELLELFDKYARGEVPLVVPVTLLKHHFRKNPNEYMIDQLYMNPYPEELMLRNHV